jgi:hypothetical protein
MIPVDIDYGPDNCPAGKEDMTETTLVDGGSQHSCLPTVTEP